jgi:tetratricopeptide (TPR) repeat protein
VTEHFGFVVCAALRRFSVIPMCISRSLCFFSTLVRPTFSRSRKFIGVCSALLPLLALAHGTFDARLAALGEKLALQPENAVLHFNLAELYCEHEEPAKALDELARVKSLGVGELPWDYLSGMCLRQAGRPEEALVALDRYVAVNPDSSPGHLQRARVHTALGHADASLEDYRVALRLCSRLEPDLVQESADAFAAQGQSDEAVRVLDAALRKLGPIPSLTLRALELEAFTKRFTAALARIDVLQKTAPRPEPWMAKRAMVLSQAGRTAEARAAWTALIAHLAALPNLERGSHSMSVLAEQAHRELRSLDTASVSPASSSAPATSPRPVSAHLSPPDNLSPARHS